MVSPLDDDAVAAAVLGDAFAADPFMAWIFPDADRRPGQIARMWEFVVDGRDRATSVLLGDEADAGCVSFWRTPELGSDGDASGPEGDEVEPDGEGDDETPPFVAWLFEQLGDDAMARLETFGAMQEAHPSEPHWYLFAIGTRRDRQGSGLGGAMMAPMLQRADTEGLGCYLESTNPRNLPFYFRHGFEAVGEIHTPDGHHAMTRMWRDPR